MTDEESPAFNENALRWLPHDRTDDKPILVQVIVWWRYATSH